MRPWTCVQYGLFVAIAAVTALFVGRAEAQSISDEQMVSAAYPDALVQNFYSWAKPNQRLVKRFGFARADLGGTGTDDFIVAAYTNGLGGAIRVLRPSNGTAQVVDEPAGN